MNNISLSFQLIPYPYVDDPTYSPAVRWGQIKIYILDESKNHVETVFDWQWDVRPLIQWFIDHNESILSENLPKLILNSKGDSIAEKIYNIYDEESMTDDDYDLIRDYQTRHNFSFSMMGVDTDDVIFGINDGQLEASLHETEKSWKYVVSMDELFSYVKRKLDEFNIHFDDDKLYRT